MHRLRCAPGLGPFPHGSWGLLSGQLLRKLWGTAVSVTPGMSTVTSSGVALCWHPVAHVPLCGVPVFQGSLVSLGTEIAQPVSALVTPCHKPRQRPVPTLLTGCCRLVFTVRASPASLGLPEAAEFFALILLSP